MNNQPITCIQRVCRKHAIRLFCDVTMRLVIEKISTHFNRLLHKYLFQCSNNRQLLKALWVKKKLQQTAFKNIVGNDAIARNQQLLLFPQCFLLSQLIVPHLSIFLTSYLRWFCGQCRSKIRLQNMQPDLGYAPFATLWHKVFEITLKWRNL